jgi:hypothetical protein
MRHATFRQYWREYPFWVADTSRNGAKVAYSSNGVLYVMNADGSNQTRITNNSANDFFPVWGGPGLNQPPTTYSISGQVTDLYGMPIGECACIGNSHAGSGSDCFNRSWVGGRFVPARGE